MDREGMGLSPVNRDSLETNVSNDDINFIDFSLIVSGLVIVARRYRIMDYVLLLLCSACNCAKCNSLL
jgi:hypothetical protein